MYVIRILVGRNPQLKSNYRQITISITAPQGIVNRDLLTIDVGPEMTIADLKAVIHSDTNVKPELQVLYYNGKELDDDAATLDQAQIKGDDMLGMLVRPTALQPGPSTRARATQERGAVRGQGGRGPNSGADAEVIRLQALGNPVILQQIRNRSSELADVVNDPNRWQQVYYGLISQQQEIEAEKQREMALLNADPFNVDAQAKIEEMIRQERVIENLQHAIDYTPEEVNGYKVKAFVDSGAQATIMSPACAEKCGIMRLIDKRFAGEARGVGTAKILGRVHSAQIKIGHLFLACTFSVIEGKDVDLLLGLDMLKRHQACIDLRRHRLVIQDAEVPFLGEAEIPRNEENLLDELPLKTASETSSGASSHTVRQDNGASGSSTRTEQDLGGSSANVTQPSEQGRSLAAHPPFPAADIAKLMDMGFSREEAVHGLELAGGNVDMAAGLLM
ncbi:MAG: hypothetical protein LQ342_003062 [Letrouitia transgressa]|nr:MAG: hypothetical protein LQ342_003062 [Letrouitia transgressa]